MRKLLLILCLVPFFSFGQNIEWLKTNQTIAYEDIAIDNYDGMYLLSSTHTFVDTAFIGDTTIINNSHQIIKYDTNGVFLWARGVNFPFGNYNVSISVDGDNLYVYGSFDTSLEVNGNLFNTISNAIYGFIIKYNIYGNYISTKIIESTLGLCYIKDLNIIDNEVYILGEGGGAFTINNSTYQLLYNDSLHTTGFVLKLDSNNIIWGSSFYANSSGAQPYKNCLYVDKVTKRITIIAAIGLSDSLYFNGQFQDSINGSFVLELNDNGSLNWIYNLNYSNYKDIIHNTTEILIADDETVIVLDSNGLLIKQHVFSSTGIGNYPPKVFRFTKDNNSCYMLGFAYTDNATLNNVSIPINLNNRLFVAKYEYDTIIDFKYYGSTAVHLTPYSFEVKNNSYYIHSSKLIFTDSVFIINNDTIPHSSHMLFKASNNSILNVVDFDILGNTTNKKLLKIIDILGRETKPKKNILLFYIYSDGTVKKQIIIE